MEKLIVESKLDKEYVLNNGTNKNVIVQLNLAAAQDLVASTNRGTHFCIVLDVSGSMFYATNVDEAYKNIDKSNRTMIENQNAIKVDGNIFPATIDIAIKSIKKALKKMGPNDKLSLITYNEDAKVIIEGCSVTNKDFITHQLDNLDKQPPGELNKYTNISTSLYLTNEVLSKYENDNRKIIFLTDGRPSFNKVRNGKPVDTLEACVAASNTIANSNIPIDYIGLQCMKIVQKDAEELDFAFLEDLSSKSNGSVYLVQDEESCDINLSTIIDNSKKASIPRAELKIELNENIKCGDYYMVQPQNKYCGILRPNKNRLVSIDLNEISTANNYSFVCSLNVDMSKYSNTENIQLMRIKAKYTVDIDGKLETRMTPIKNVILSTGNDEQKALDVNGSVQDYYEIATIKKYERQYQTAYRNGGKEDIVIANIEKIIDIYEEQGEKELASINRALLEEFKREGLITQAAINRQSNVSSTIKVEPPVITGRAIRRKVSNLKKVN